MNNKISIDYLVNLVDENLCSLENAAAFLHDNGQGDEVLELLEKLSQRIANRYAISFYETEAKRREYEIRKRA